MGYIYAIGETEDGPIKIGLTTGLPSKRLRGIQTSHYRPLSILDLVQVPNKLAYRIELYIHDALANYALHGEWFGISMDQIQLSLLVEQALHALANPHDTVMNAPNKSRKISDTPPSGQHSLLFPLDHGEEDTPSFSYAWDDDQIEIALDVPDGDYVEALQRVRARLGHHLDIPS